MNIKCSLSSPLSQKQKTVWSLILEGSYSLNFHNPQTEPEKIINITQQRMWSQGPNITIVSAGVIILFMVGVDFFKIIFPESSNDGDTENNAF